MRRLFLLFTCLYLLSLGRGFYSSDGEVMFKTTAALVDRGSFVIQPDPGLPQIVRGQDGRWYSKYDPGLPLLAVPFYVIGDWIGQINHAHRTRLAATFVLMIPALAGAGTLAGLYRLARGCFGEPRAVGVTLIAGLATILWPYARVLFPEAVLACALAWAVVFIIEGAGQTDLEKADNDTGGEPVFRRGRFPNLPWTGHRPAPTKHPRIALTNNIVHRREHRDLKGKTVGAYRNTPLQNVRPYLSSAFLCDLCALCGKSAFRFFLAGVALGIGILTRAALIIYALPLAVLIVRLAPARRTLIARLIAFAAGMLPFGLILLWHNVLRFGSPLDTGYSGEGFTTPAWEGVTGLLVSPGKSVFLYAPPLVLSLILWPRFRRAHPALADFLALAWGLALLVYGAWWAWDGGWCWGPRLLVPLIPLSCLPLGMLPDRRGWRLVAGGLIAVGIAVQGAGVLTDVTPHYRDVIGTDESRVTLVNFAPRQSPLVGAVRRLIAGDTEPLALFHLDDSGLPPTWTLGLPLILLAGLAVGAVRIIFNFRKHPAVQ